MAKFKSMFTVFLFIALLLGAIIVPVVITNEKEAEAEAFPNAQKIDVSEKTINSETKNAKTRKTLEKDEYFKRFATTPSYNYANIRKEVDPSTGLTYSYIEDGYLKDMIINFTYNYQLTNVEPLSSINYETEYFCMTNSKVKDAFEELYYSSIGMGDFIEYIPGYIDYVTSDGSNICFNYGKVNKMNNSELLIGIKKLTISEQKNITADVYLYRFNDKRYKKNISNYIDSRNYSAASDLVINQLKGSVEHKKIVFRLNSKKKYYEYKLLYSAVID